MSFFSFFFGRKPKPLAVAAGLLSVEKDGETTFTHFEKAMARSMPKASVRGPLKDQFIGIIGAPNDGDLACELAAAGAHISATVGRSVTLVVVAEERPFCEETLSCRDYKRAEQIMLLNRGARTVSLSEIRMLISGECSLPWKDRT